jgi:hypothetical protein
MDPFTAGAAVVGFVASCWTLLEAIQKARKAFELKKLQELEELKGLLRDLEDQENTLNYLCCYLDRHKNDALEKEADDRLSKYIVQCSEAVRTLKERIRRYRKPQRNVVY